jgi:SAM-dependent methyltransferase
MPAMDYALIADLYDSYVQTKLDLPFFASYVEIAENVLELMAGTGRLSIPFSEMGARLTCVDISPQMLSRLQKKAEAKSLNIEIICQDVCDLDLGRKFDLILLPFNSFSEIIDPHDQKRALDSIRDHLVERGKFILTLHNPPIRLAGFGQGLKLLGKFLEANRSILLWSRESLDPNSQIVSGMQFVEVYDPAGVMIEKRYVDIQFYLHKPSDLENMLAEVGFKIMARYGDYQRAPFDADTSQFIIWELT